MRRQPAPKTSILESLPCVTVSIQDGFVRLLSGALRPRRLDTEMPTLTRSTIETADLLSLAVHEFRTPVTVVAGYLRMLAARQARAARRASARADPRGRNRARG